MISSCHRWGSNVLSCVIDGKTETNTLAQGDTKSEQGLGLD